MRLTAAAVTIAVVVS